MLQELVLIGSRKDAVRIWNDLRDKNISLDSLKLVVLEQVLKILEAEQWWDEQLILLIREKLAIRRIIDIWYALKDEKLRLWNVSEETLISISDKLKQENWSDIELISFIESKMQEKKQREKEVQEFQRRCKNIPARNRI